MSRSVRASLRSVIGALVAVVWLALPRTARAHKPSDAYLFLTVSGSVVTVRWDVALRDLDDAVGLDRNENGEITWAETRLAADAIAAATWPALAIAANGGPGATGSGVSCTRIGESPPAIVRHSDGAYVVLRRDLSCGVAPSAVTVRYGLFFERDPHHRAVVRVDSGAASHSFVLTASQREARVDLGDPSASRRAFVAMAREGVSHIAQGYDHLLFLFALLLPSVLERRRGALVPVRGFRPALVDVLRVVTAFTVAHSLTLSLAALDVVRLPSRLVESVIAASVVAAATNNLIPLFRDGRWSAAFALGLMHGFGFSATLADLELGRGALVVSLLGFNVGVELGQLALVAAFLPVAYAARRTWFYRRGVLGVGSLAIAAIALVWLVERAFAVRLVP